MPIPATNPIAKLAAKHRLRLPAIHLAYSRSQAEIKELQNELAPLAPTDSSIVIFGSLARNEQTSGSDLDWSLVIDGATRPEHKTVGHEINRHLDRLGKRRPNLAGAFGATTFSHDLVHSIGGESDSNRNTTRRMLLLLESVALGDDDAWNRVVKAILQRYFEQEPYSAKQRRSKRYFPRFLFNDIVRFWRTMAVDYAAKVVDRNWNGWALRNAKLRLSRKLIFASGLLIAYEPMLNPVVEVDLFGQSPNVAPLIQQAIELVRMTPLEILARSFLQQKADRTTVSLVFNSYDRFLALLHDRKKRRILNKLAYEQAENDAIFTTVRQLGAYFDEGLLKFFLDGPPAVRVLTRRYAIF